MVLSNNSRKKLKNKKNNSRNRTKLLKRKYNIRRSLQKGGVSELNQEQQNDLNKKVVPFVSTMIMQINYNDFENLYDDEEEITFGHTEKAFFEGTPKTTTNFLELDIDIDRINAFLGLHII